MPSPRRSIRAVILDTPARKSCWAAAICSSCPLISPKLQRFQGCFVSDGEVEDLVHYLKQQSLAATVAAAEAAVAAADAAAAAVAGKSVPPAAGDSAPAAGEQSAPWDDLDAEEGEGGDELLQSAIDLVRQHRQASASFLQRHMRIGYPRAARLIDELEELGVVGPAETGGRSRAVLDDGDEEGRGPAYGRPHGRRGLDGAGS